MTDHVKLVGKLVEGDPGRDAIHIAIIPMVAISDLQPGQHLRSGIVDPYLKEPVKRGEKFFLFLYPGTVTSLRHVWTHPAFADESIPSPKRRSEADVWANFVEANGAT